MNKEESLVLSEVVTRDKLWENVLLTRYIDIETYNALSVCHNGNRLACLGAFYCVETRTACCFLDKTMIMFKQKEILKDFRIIIKKICFCGPKHAENFPFQPTATNSKKIVSDFDNETSIPILFTKIEIRVNLVCCGCRSTVINYLLNSLPKAFLSFGQALLFTGDFTRECERRLEHDMGDILIDACPLSVEPESIYSFEMNKADDDGMFL
ncbi:CLUMA_CG006060, isoform A [Clunio marinus]|uniref:CLUMA_CG006060, isoform A n=1 Tax=Clunio marinus TaxID=568069 RepID=A0A1J1HYT0_9DIPT|nr:CLUMA_CG006060, isoform A [Clunio marinus]